MAAFDLIEEQILGSNATAVSFYSIPSDYAHLKVEITVEATSSDEPIRMQFNNDTNSRYSWFRHYAYNGNSSYGIEKVDDGTFISIGDAISSSYVGSIEVWIPDYANTSKWTTTISKIANRRWWSHGVGAWKQPSMYAVDAIKLYTPVSNNFQSGGQFKLWGYKDS